MSKISLIAKLTLSDDADREQFEQQLADLIAAAEEEEGLEVYSVHRDPNEAGSYYFFELYRDDEALGVHGKGERMRPGMKALGSFLSGRPEVTRLQPVAAKGLSV